MQICLFNCILFCYYYVYFWKKLLFSATSICHFFIFDFFIVLCNYGILHQIVGKERFKCGLNLNALCNVWFPPLISRWGIEFANKQSYLPWYPVLKHKLMDNDTMIDLRELTAMLYPVLITILASLTLSVDYVMLKCLLLQRTEQQWLPNICVISTWHVPLCVQ